MSFLNQNRESFENYFIRKECNSPVNTLYTLDDVYKQIEHTVNSVSCYTYTYVHTYIRTVWLERLACLSDFTVTTYVIITLSLPDSNKIWSDGLSDQIIRREPKGLSWWTVRVTMNVRSICVWSDIMEDQ